MISHDDCDEILCTNRSCECNEDGYCYIAYNQLNICKAPVEYIAECIKITEDYIRDIPDIIDKEFIESETANARNRLRFWKSLLYEYGG